MNEGRIPYFTEQDLGIFEKNGNLKPDRIKGLASELAKPRDFAVLFRDFDNGDTSVGDVSKLTLNKRKRILSTKGTSGLIRSDKETLSALSEAVANFGELMLHPMASLNQSGLIFLEEAQRFLSQDLPGSQELNSSIRQSFGRDIAGFINDYNDSPESKVDINLQIERFARNERHIYNIGYYLANRSRSNELAHIDQHGELLEIAKLGVVNTITGIAAETGLPDSYQQLAHDRLKRTCFGSANLLIGRKIDKNKVHGWYLPGTFRIEVIQKIGHFGTDAFYRDVAKLLLRHETFHSTSAQFDSSASGLSTKEKTGLEADEGMTEYLAQAASGFPDFHRNSSGQLFVNSIYGNEVATVHELRRSSPHFFAQLFNAYYGHVSQDLFPPLHQYYLMLNEEYRKT